MLTSVRTLRHRSIFSMATMRWGKEQRAKDGSLSIVTMDEALDAVAQEIVHGTKNTGRDGERIILRLGEAAAVLVKNPNNNAWILTGWSLSKKTIAELKKLPPDERRSAFLNSAPTLASSTRSRASEGAGGAQEHGITPLEKAEDTDVDGSMQEAESGATDAPGAYDVQAPKQGRATNAEELAGLLKGRSLPMLRMRMYVLISTRRLTLLWAMKRRGFVMSLNGAPKMARCQ